MMIDNHPQQNTVEGKTPRLTRLSHGGGCGCKVAPAVLQQLLTRSKDKMPLLPPQLLVGRETSDDAAVWLIDEHQAIVATTDFFMPIVDDPFHFGQIAATNAISDVYAMGAKPLFALAVVGMPLERLPLEVIAQILQGGEETCHRAGIPLAGGHTIDSLEPIYGLVAIGAVNPANLKQNNGARVGDKLILGKGLGVGIYAAAYKKDRLGDGDYRVLIESTTQLNKPGPVLACCAGVHALTDVTGFGLLGHLLEMLRASQVKAVLDYHSLPLLPGVLDYVRAGFMTGASGRNWASYGKDINLDTSLDEADRALLTDPQTSGGLLLACAPEEVDQVLSIFLQQGFARAAVIGEIAAGEPCIDVVCNGG